MLTRRGLIALVGGLALTGGGWALGWPELVALGVAAIVAVVIALGWLAVRPRVEVVREIEPDRVMAGGIAFGRVKVFNASRRASFAFVARERFGDGFVDVPIPRLSAGGRKSTTYRLPSTARGVVSVGPLFIGRGDPLGLVRAEREHGDVVKLWVHPRHHALSPLPASLTRSLEGPTSDTAPNGTITFHALREYVRGDDLRQVHWRSTAKTGTLMVRQHVDTSLPDAMVVVDTRASTHADAPDSLEVAMEVTASVVLASTSRHFPVQVRTTGGLDLNTRGGGNASQEILDELAALDAETPTGARPTAASYRGDGDGSTSGVHGHARSLTELLNTLARARGGSALVVVTAAPTAEERAGIAAMTRRYKLVTLVDCRADAAAVLPLAGVVVIAAPSGAAFAATWNRRLR
jgi:uncharacterized protein (DUF58 family)